MIYKNMAPTWNFGTNRHTGPRNAIVEYNYFYVFTPVDRTSISVVEGEGRTSDIFVPRPT